MGPASVNSGLLTAASPNCASAWRALLRFSLWTVGLSLAFSLIALPWVPLVWWRVIRRCVSISAALALWFCVYRHERRTFACYGLPGWPTRREAAQLLTGLLLATATLMALFSFGLAAGFWWIHITPDRIRLWRTVTLFVPAALLVATLEELVFRGYLLQHLLVYSRRTAVIASSACYALVHLKTMVLTPPGARELAGLFLIGIILSISALRTGRLYMAVGLHAALAYGARVNKLLIRTDEVSWPDWLVGTNRLVNGLTGWLALIALAGLMWQATRVASAPGPEQGRQT